MTEKVPRIIVGNYPSGGKTVAQMQDLIRLAKKLDGMDKGYLLIAQNYDKELQKMSGGSIGLRIWVDWDDSLRCIPVYPNSAIRELMEVW